MSSSTYRNNITRINSQIADLLKKQVAERKKEADTTSKINDLSKRTISSKSISTTQSYQRQIDSKTKDLLRIKQTVINYEKKINDKKKELFRNEENLNKSIENGNKKKQSDELRFLREKQRLNNSDLENIRRYNAELEKQQSIFENYEVSKSALQDNDTDYSLGELNDLHTRIDVVLDKLEQLGYGQEIIFDEIEELKDKSKKISKKDVKMMLIGKIVSFGMGKITPELAADIFQEITTVDLTRLIE